MIRSIDVRNFRCYKHLRINNVGRLNVITGDNASGKTALLESIFLPLSTGSEVAMRFRRQRGMHSLFTATARRIEESIWGDFFHNYEMNNPISISLNGDGDESRSLSISRGPADLKLSLDSDSDDTSVIAAPVTFTWTNAAGQESQVVPQIKDGSISFPETGEDMANFFYIPALGVVSASESAGRFSDLSQVNQQHKFIKIFTKEFNAIKDLSIEVSAGAPAIFATIEGMDRKIPLPNLSSGINRMTAILLAIASKKRSIVLVDEIENGMYFRHFPAMWSSILTLLRENDSQLFVSTHSLECLNGLAEVMGRKTDDVVLWQTEKNNGKNAVSQFSGKDMSLAIKYGENIR